MSAARKSLSSFWSPRYWPVWLGMGVLRLICLLPHQFSLAIGRVLGRLVHAAGGSRRAVVRRNIELCFPDLSPAARDALAYDHFKALGMTLIEMGLGRWATDRHLASITKLTGIEHVHEALQSGKGVILLSAHFTTLEIMGRVLALNMPPFDAVFRRNRSEFMTELQRTGRERSAESTIEKRDIKKMVRSLRAGRAVWYAPDQSYNRKGSEVIPFFVAEGWQEATRKIRFAETLELAVDLNESQYNALHSGGKPQGLAYLPRNEFVIERVGQRDERHFADIGIEYYRYVS